MSEPRIRNRRVSLTVAGVLMILLGLLRALGGVALLVGGAETLDDVIATSGQILGVAVGLLVIGLAEMVCGAGVIRGSLRAWRWGIAVTVLFVVDGAINGWLLFGRPGDGGTMVNIAAAAIIIVLLVRGKRAS